MAQMWIDNRWTGASDGRVFDVRNPATEDVLDAPWAWARRTVIWVVPAQHGTRGMCFAGCLPASWHGEDETPGVDVVLRALAPSSQPHSVAVGEWTFSGIVADVAELANYLADRLGWPDSRRPDMSAHLARQAKPDAGGYRLDIPRRSAVLVWAHDRGGVGD